MLLSKSKLIALFTVLALCITQSFSLNEKYTETPAVKRNDAVSNYESNLRGAFQKMVNQPNSHNNKKTTGGRKLSSCSVGYFMTPNGSCDTDPCAACPSGNMCTDGPNGSTVCYDCSCGLCNENSDSCCELKNQNQDFCSAKKLKGQSVCDNGSNTFFPGLTNGNLCKQASDFSTELPPDSCSCVPSADQVCVLTYPGAAEGCHAKSSADLVNGSGGSCTTCLINECGASFDNCLSAAITTEDAETCVANTSFSCRNNCYVQCVLTNGAVPATPTVPPEAQIPPTAPPTEAPVDPDPVTPTFPPDPITAGGDPHFTTFNGQFFSFHGECDLVLMKPQEFASGGQGPTIHIRTTRVERLAAKYSYISGAAIAIGSDILEVLDDGSLIINGEVSRKMDDGVNNTTTFHGKVVTKTFRGSKHAIVVYDIPFGARSPIDSMDDDTTAQSVQIRINTSIGMIFLEVNGSYPDNVGMMGNPKLKDSLMARDGFTNLLGIWNTFAEEWQVRNDEPQLFQDKNRPPQYPAGCRYEQSAPHPHQRGGSKSSRRRLLAHTEVTMRAATEACAGSLNDNKKKFCVDDVMATGHLELAEDPFYH